MLSHKKWQNPSSYIFIHLL